MTHQRNAKTFLTITLIIVFLCGIIGYAAFQARRIIGGPILTITSPLIEGTLSDPLVKVTGIAQNIKEISMNGNPIYIDEQGNFNEKVVLTPGYNIIELEAKDKFNKQTKKIIEVILKETLST